MAARVSWLHVSDFHFKGGDSYDSDVVLRALVKSVRYYYGKGRRPDLIFATGDIAHSGQDKEYKSATPFFDALIAAAGVEKRNLFVIPGNHDVDRDLGVGLARTLTSREEADKYFNPATTKVHITQKLGAFAKWYNHYFDGIRTFPENSTCSTIHNADVRGLKIGILPINSALFCQDDNDHAKLWVGRRCVDNAIKDLKERDTILNIALVHHPLDWLSEIEAANIKTALATNFDFILRGHLHTLEVDAVTGISGRMRHLAAGAGYQTRKWRNQAIYADVEGDRITIFPVRYEDQPEEMWTLDPTLFPGEPNHQMSFPIPQIGGHRDTTSEKPREAVPAPQFKSNIPSRRNLPFVGREGLLEKLTEILRDVPKETIVVLHGPPGVGKSELAREFARRRRNHYPGGTFIIEAGAAQIDLAKIGRALLDLDFPADLGLDDQCVRTLRTLAEAPSLLIFDNVQSLDGVLRWLPPAGMPCHVVMTTLLDRWDAGWLALSVDPLSDTDSLELVEKLAGRDVAERYGGEIVTLAGGLPVQIVPASATVAYEVRRGRRGAVMPTLTREASQSFQGVYAQLEAPVRLLLHAAARFNSQRITRDELKRHLNEGAGWSEAEFQRALDAGLDLHLLQDGPELRMHQLFASFVRGTAPSEDIRESLTKVVQRQARRIVEIATEVAARPNRADLAAALLAFPLDPTNWKDVDSRIPIEGGETLGQALGEIGQFAAARPWFERAVEAAEKGGANGHVSHERLGNSLHQVGFCLSSMGDFAAARPWFERAVEVAEKGDTRGRVNHDSLGGSLHQLGFCWWSMGEFTAAQPWLERAVAAREKGNIEGRVDYDGLGASLLLLGFCLKSMGDDTTARRWFERAVAAIEKGDTDGRIDHDKLGRSLHEVGICLANAGETADARSWFERAVAAKEKGDVHGRINYTVLSISLNGVASCVARTNGFAAARSWHERAVAAAEKGDIHGRVNHDTLGWALHQVGYCLVEMGEFEGARSWIERAIAAKEKGDVYARIDNDNLGRSLHLLGFCLVSTGAFAAARPWFERAVAAKEKGDLHGRIDYPSLARSLRTGADCLRKLSLDDQAKDWDERASKLNK